MHFLKVMLKLSLQQKKRLQTVWLGKYDLDYMEIGLTEAGNDLVLKAKCLVSQSKTLFFYIFFFSAWMLW